MEKKIFKRSRKKEFEYDSCLSKAPLVSAARVSSSQKPHLGASRPLGCSDPPSGGSIVLQVRTRLPGHFWVKAARLGGGVCTHRGPMLGCFSGGTVMLLVLFGALDVDI